MSDLNENMQRLHLIGFAGVWAVNPNEVNIEDLLGPPRFGKIVRCHDVNAIRFIPAEGNGCEECIAGWISEES